MSELTRKITAALMAMLLAMTMGSATALPAFAVPQNTGTVTIANSDAGLDGITYDGYRIFDAEFVDGQAKNVRWASNAVKDAVEKTIADFDPTYDGFTPFDVVYYLQEHLQSLTPAAATDKTDSAYVLQSASLGNLIAKAIEALPDGNAAISLKAGETSAALNDGYYLFLTDISSLNAEAPEQERVWQTASAPAFVQVESGKTTTITPKTTTPTISKQVKENSKVDPTDPEAGFSDRADVNIDEIVEFKLIGTVPADVIVYDKFRYSFVDDISLGLRFMNDSFVVEHMVTNDDGAVSVNIVPRNEYKLMVGGHRAIISFPNAKNYAGQSIVIHYKAYATKQMMVGTDTSTGLPNVNSAHLVYSNNPHGYVEGSDPAPDPAAGGYRYVHEYYTDGILDGKSYIQDRTNLPLDDAVSYKEDTVTRAPMFSGHKYDYFEYAYGTVTGDGGYAANDDMEGVIATADNSQIIILRYNRLSDAPAMEKGSYKIVHEYYTDGEFDGRSGITEIDRLDTDGYVYDDSDVAHKCFYDGNEYAYRDTVYGKFGEKEEDAGYAPVDGKIGVIATPDGSEIIILRYDRISEDGKQGGYRVVHEYYTDGNFDGIHPVETVYELPLDDTAYTSDTIKKRYDYNNATYKYTDSSYGNVDSVTYDPTTEKTTVSYAADDAKTSVFATPASSQIIILRYDRTSSDPYVPDDVAGNPPTGLDYDEEEPQVPDYGGETTSKTEKVEVLVRTYQVNIHKVAEDYVEHSLEGVQFTMKDETGRYVAPSGLRSDVPVKFSTSDPDGVAVVRGLDAGTYVIHEVAPYNSYDPLPADITLVIESEIENDGRDGLYAEIVEEDVPLANGELVSMDGEDAINGHAGTIQILVKNVPHLLNLPITGAQAVAIICALALIAAVLAGYAIIRREARKNRELSAKLK